MEKSIYGKNFSLKEKHTGLSFKLNADGSWLRFYLRACLARRYRDIHEYGANGEYCANGSSVQK